MPTGFEVLRVEVFLLVGHPSNLWLGSISSCRGRDGIYVAPAGLAASHVY